jgi:DNA repair protein RecN (Recombination protein N)
MLLELRLRDFVIVDHLELAFGSGFTVLTGETGAGKSILIDALGLALGARADAGVVREGQSRADISACFATDTALAQWLIEHDLTGDEGQVLLRRIIEADGRSRAQINGHPATATQLREIGARLVEIHGQHAAQSLLRSDGQRSLLDQIGGVSLQALAQAHGQWRERAGQLESARQGEREHALERERLQWQADELDSVAPESGEWEALQIEQRRLAHAASLIEGSQALADALERDDQSIASQLHASQNRLRSLAGLDERLTPILELLESATIQIEEAASSLQSHADRVDLDAARLAQIESRISVLFGLARKLRLPPEQLADEQTRVQESLRALERAQDLERLQSEADEAQARYQGLADQVRKARLKVAARLSQGVTERLTRLGMQGARLQIVLEPSEPAAHGCDRVEFLIASHAGTSARPLLRVASGGELSRVSLAISALAAQDNPVGTLIFDEADAGVGGSVATVIGELMRDLGQSRQVLCVTHLPQVAACAHHHLRVSKSEVKGRTLSRIEPLSDAARTDEMARMLGGAEVTATTRRHAQEMLSRSSASPVPEGH